MMTKPDFIIYDYLNKEDIRINVHIWFFTDMLSGTYWMSNWDSSHAYWKIEDEKLQYSHSNHAESWGKWSSPSDAVVINAIQDYKIEQIIFGDIT